MSTYQLHHGDCLEVLPTLPDTSVDMVLCDLPYGTTRNKWDTVIPLEPLWAQYKRVCKPTAAIVLTAQTPFDKVLGCSNLAWLRYEWIWLKTQATGHLNAERAPMKEHEHVLVFCARQPHYCPQFKAGVPYSRPGGPPSANYGRQEYRRTIQEARRYPTTALTFAKDTPRTHPTQKPVALMAYMIRTYTDPGMTVLDNCMGSGSTGVAATQEGRSFIGIERDGGYYQIACDRLASAQPALREEPA